MKIQTAIMSLASAEPLADLVGTLALIRREGGKKGNGMLCYFILIHPLIITGLVKR